MWELLLQHLSLSYLCTHYYKICPERGVRNNTANSMKTNSNSCKYVFCKFRLGFKLRLPVLCCYSVFTCFSSKSLLEISGFVWTRKMDILVLVLWKFILSSSWFYVLQLKAECLRKLVDIFNNITFLVCVLKGNRVHFQFFCAHIFRLQLMGNPR